MWLKQHHFHFIFLIIKLYCEVSILTLTHHLLQVFQKPIVQVYSFPDQSVVDTITALMLVGVSDRKVHFQMLHQRYNYYTLTTPVEDK